MNTIGDIKIGKVNQNLPNYISIRCDRKTVLGNPFFMHNESQRDMVCDKYKTWLENRDAEYGAVHDMLNDIIMKVELGNNVLLQCHCYPKRCHTESIREHVLGQLHLNNQG